MSKLERMVNSRLEIKPSLEGLHRHQAVLQRKGDHPEQNARIDLVIDAIQLQKESSQASKEAGRRTRTASGQYRPKNGEIVVLAVKT